MPRPASLSTRSSANLLAGESAGPSDGLAALAVELEGLAAQDLDGLADGVRAERVLRLRWLVDRLVGHWLRHRLRMGAGAARGRVRTARARFRGPLTRTAQALTDGAISPAHASVVARGTEDLPAHTAVGAEPVLLETAHRLDPPRLRRVIAHLQLVADPEGAEARADRQHERRGLWLAATLEGMVAVDGLLEPEAGQTLVGCGRS